MIPFEIAGRKIGSGHKPYFVAEMSANHQHCIEQARAIISCAKKNGADAVKLQTYTADTITLPVRTEDFKVNGPWEKFNYLYDLYKNSYTPWEWYEDLYDHAEKIGIVLFSTPFDETSVDFIESKLKPPVYKIASFEITHIPLLKKVAATNKPVILSTGMASEEEIDEAICALKSGGCKNFMLLKCISSYPADPKDFNLLSINALRERFGCEVGLSDHCISSTIVLGAVALGASLVEKHIALTRSSAPIDESFSLEPEEFKMMVSQAMELSSGLGNNVIGQAKQEESQCRFRRSIFSSAEIKKGDVFTEKNIKIIRPATGLAPKHWDDIIGKKAADNIGFGTPLRLEHVDKS